MLGNEKLLESRQHVAHELTWKLVSGDNAFLVFCSPHCCDVTGKCTWSFRDSCERVLRKIWQEGDSSVLRPNNNRCTCQVISAGNTGGRDFVGRSISLDVAGCGSGISLSTGL